MARRQFEQAAASVPSAAYNLGVLYDKGLGVAADAAQALGINTFRYKMLAVLISSAMSALSGVFFAFYYNNLFPEQIFGMGRVA